MKRKPLVVVGLVGSVLDGAGSLAKAQSQARWDRWRPSVDLVRHANMPVARLELLHQPEHQGFAEVVAHDVHKVSDTRVNLHRVQVKDPWDFELMYSALFDFCSGYTFNPDREDYLVHITTGTHVAQICWFLLAESKHVPGNLLQTGPPKTAQKHRDRLGTITTIDLDLSRYDRLRQRFTVQTEMGVSSLKDGVPTKDAHYNAVIAELSQVASLSSAPLLLLGATGTGKTQLARRIYELKKARNLVKGAFVEVNCATLRGEGAMSTLFGHKKGAFTGAITDREGLLKRADGGVLFLDEVGELGLDEQAMLLRAVEEMRFLPLGADKEVTSQFQLLCGTHRNLHQHVAEKLFREDLLARIDVWSFALPRLRDRPTDIAPNLDVELERSSTVRGSRITMTADARAAFLQFAQQAPWPGNFREFGACVERMATLCTMGRITMQDVQHETARKQSAWQVLKSANPHANSTDTALDLTALLGSRALAVDAFDAVQLQHVLQVCKRSKTASDAGRVLFAVSRTKRTTPNDADRLRKYLAGYGLEFSNLAR